MNPKNLPSTECDGESGCHGTGWAPVVRHGVRQGVARCTACTYWDTLRGRAPGMPDAEIGSTLANYKVTKDNADAVKHGQLWLEGIHPDLYLFGSVGTGKTRLAASLVNQVWTTGIGVRFVRVPELLLRLVPSADDADAYLDLVIGTPVLVLDDVGANQGTDYARRMLQTVYDARADRGHRTIWTSNLNLDELATFLGGDARLPSRIAGRAKVIELGGKDWRLSTQRTRRTADRARV